jgi:hypothetical protein
MRSIVFGLCVLAAGCSGQSVSSPTSPSTTGLSSFSGTSWQARNATSLPLSGTYTGGSHSTFLPPSNLILDGTGTGTASHLGRFTLSQIDLVDLTQSTSTGTFTLTASNGDLLSAETAGGEVGFTPPNISETTLTGTIVSGTGRFAHATGTFTIHNTQVIDFATSSASYTGSFEGQLELNN